MVSKVDCICDVLYEISEFESIMEFERFEKYINKFTEDKYLIEIAVQKYYAGFKERWFLCPKCTNVWRLVYPDFPFKGIWEKVKVNYQFKPQYII